MHMKRIDRKLLSELLKDSKRSDRELAKVLGVSQPTITRRRSRLVEEGIIQEFTVIPDFARLGYEIMAITLGSYRVTRTPELLERGQKWVTEHPSVIFASQAHGMGRDAVMISMHKNYTDYSRFMADLRSTFGDSIKDSDTMIVSLKEFIAKPLSLRYLAEEKSED